MLTTLSIVMWSVQTLFSITDQRRAADIMFALSGLAVVLLAAFGVVPIWTHLIAFLISLVVNVISATLYVRKCSKRKKAWMKSLGECSSDVVAGSR